MGVFSEGGPNGVDYTDSLKCLASETGWQMDKRTR
jgi:hypothetical protein